MTVRLDYGFMMGVALAIGLASSAQDFWSCTLSEYNQAVRRWIERNDPDGKLAARIQQAKKASKNVAPGFDQEQLDELFALMDKG